MKTLLKLLLTAILALTLFSCVKNKIFDREQENTTSVVLEAMSLNEYIFNAGNANDPFVIKWTSEGFEPTSQITYTLTLTKFSEDEEITLGTTSENELRLTNADINTLAGNLRVEPGKTIRFGISLSFSGDADGVAENTIDFYATPFDPKAVEWDYVYVVEDNGEWDFNDAYLLGDPDGDGIFEGFVYFIDEEGVFIIRHGKTFEVLLWEQHTPAEGFYYLTFDGNNVNIGEALTWGIIGDATPGGWNTDTMLEYDTATRLWTATCFLLNDGELHFRANKSWDTNMGDAAGGQAALEGELVFDGNNITVAYDNNYNFVVTMDLTGAGKYAYRLEPIYIEPSTRYVAMPGAYQNPAWDPAGTDCYQLESEFQNYFYTGFHYMPADTEFKFWDDGVWIGIDGAITWNSDRMGGSFSLDSDGDNIVLDNGDFYKFVFAAQNLTCDFIRSGWSLIGSGSPSGDWDNDTMMNYDLADGKWKITATLVGGEMLFRWDRSNSRYLGGSLSSLVVGGANIIVPAGTYEIVLDDVALTVTLRAL